jgi:hypothetical protein
VSGAAEAAAVRDAHFQDLSHQQAAIDSGGAGSSADDASTGMRSERVRYHILNLFWGVFLLLIHASFLL